jgi:uncharacterized membrane protein YczE
MSNVGSLALRGCAIAATPSMLKANVRNVCFVIDFKFYVRVKNIRIGLHCQNYKVFTAPQILGRQKKQTAYSNGAFNIFFVTLLCRFRHNSATIITTSKQVIKTIIIYNFSSMNKKERTISFLWQHLWLLVSLFIMTLGVAVCVKSELGSSVISTLPYVFETAGKRGLGVPSLTIGQYTYIMNAILVAGQIAVLRRRFEPVQLFQLLVGFVFGSLIDLNMALTSWLLPDGITEQALAQIAGCTVLGIGIALEVRCGSVTMPGEGFPVAVSCVTGIDFPKIKIVVDCSLVVLAVAFCYVFFGAWQWYIVGVGTLFAMLYVGIVVKIAGRHMAWFDKILNYRPGFRRYVYGLAKLIFRQKQ